MSSATNLNGMFSRDHDTGYVSFNRDISGWDVSNVTNMGSISGRYGMFDGAIYFNQDISGWNVANVLYMANMFLDAYSFDQDLSSWQITQVVQFQNFMKGVTLSTANYDALLIGLGCSRSNVLYWYS
jgi:surface protein